VICTEWPSLRELDLARLAGAMADAVLVDARTLLDPDAAVAAGFTYSRIGGAG
jgi:UDPglucose 6-dehydrogenase